MTLIQAYDKKVRVVLNKVGRRLRAAPRGRHGALSTLPEPLPPQADGVSPQDLMRVYGALMWNVGGVIPSAEVREARKHPRLLPPPRLLRRTPPAPPAPPLRFNLG